MTHWRIAGRSPLTMTHSSPLIPSTRGLDALLGIAGTLGAEPACDRFIFLRHGQTARNASRIFQGPDEPLDATGEAQAVRAADILAGETFASIVCSDMRRAHHTAQTAAARHGITPLTCAGLRERNFGALVGTSSRELDWTCDPAGGESLEAFVKRARAALIEAWAHPPTALIVAHGGIFYVLAGLLRVPVSTAYYGNALPLRFVRAGTGWQVMPLDAAAAGESNIA
jgi:broad specificity phosphatase PhoE